MHRAIAGWLTERPGRAIAASAAFGVLWRFMLPLSAILAGAVPVLVTLRSNPRFGVAMASLAALLAWGLSPLPLPGIWSPLAIAWVMLGPVLLALLLRSTGSLNLCYQLAVIAAAFGLVIVHAVLDDPPALWIGMLNDLVRSMAAAGLRLEGDPDLLVRTWARTMWGTLAAVMMAMMLGALLLGRWWQSLLESPGAFGAEYRELRLGRVLGIAATVLLIAAMVSDSPLLASVAWVVFAALAFQGLAAAHRSKARGGLNRGWLAAIYVLLCVPLSTSITVFVLAVWGFADNWMRPRAS